MPRTVDTPRDAVIDRIRPVVMACYRINEQGRGRVRIVLRLRNDGKVKNVDATASGGLSRNVARCASTSIRKMTFQMYADTPRFLSFPVVLPAE